MRRRHVLVILGLLSLGILSTQLSTHPRVKRDRHDTEYLNVRLERDSTKANLSHESTHSNDAFVKYQVPLRDLYDADDIATAEDAIASRFVIFESLAPHRYRLAAAPDYDRDGDKPSRLGLTSPMVGDDVEGIAPVALPAHHIPKTRMIWELTVIPDAPRKGSPSPGSLTRLKRPPLSNITLAVRSAALLYLSASVHANVLAKRDRVRGFEAWRLVCFPPADAAAGAAPVALTASTREFLQAAVFAPTPPSTTVNTTATHQTPFAISPLSPTMPQPANPTATALTPPALPPVICVVQSAAHQTFLATGPFTGGASVVHAPLSRLALWRVTVPRCAGGAHAVSARDIQTLRAGGPVTPPPSPPPSSSSSPISPPPPALPPRLAAATSPSPGAATVACWPAALRPSPRTPSSGAAAVTRAYVAAPPIGGRAVDAAIAAGLEFPLVAVMTPKDIPRRVAVERLARAARAAGCSLVPVKERQPDPTTAPGGAAVSVAPPRGDVMAMGHRAASSAARVAHRTALCEWASAVAHVAAAAADGGASIGIGGDDGDNDPNHPEPNVTRRRIRAEAARNHARAVWGLGRIPAVVPLVVTASVATAAVAAGARVAVYAEPETHPEFRGIPTYRSVINAGFALHAEVRSPRESAPTMPPAPGTSPSGIADGAVVIFSNGDMLYAADVTETIVAVAAALPAIHAYGARAPWLIVGRRSNVNISAYLSTVRNASDASDDHCTSVYRPTTGSTVGARPEGACSSDDVLPDPPDDPTGAVAKGGTQWDAAARDALSAAADTSVRPSRFPQDAVVKALPSAGQRFVTNAEDYYVMSGALWRSIKERRSGADYYAFTNSSVKLSGAAGGDSAGWANNDRGSAIGVGGGGGGGAVPSDLAAAMDATFARLATTARIHLSLAATRDGRQAPPFVVGGVAFDNWLVGSAVRMQAARSRLTAEDCHSTQPGVPPCVVVIDASATITAVHQNHGSTKASRAHVASPYNTALATAAGGFGDGYVSDAAWVTVRAGGGIILRPRDPTIAWPPAAFAINTA